MATADLSEEVEPVALDVEPGEIVEQVVRGNDVMDTGLPEVLE